MSSGRTLLAVLVTVLIGACATSDDTYMADGRLGHVIDCTGNRKGWEACVSKAGDICGNRGYDVISKNGETTSQAVAGLQAGMDDGARSGRRTLVVACRS